ncbi:membrane associated rhomboid family serine protease [Haloferula luteola]|uniref:Membrane associated rhomboid family serine protease n=1 Tax=Haloferula luteola TaxID=595692 RepID=A0A840V337_9BACT|nr:rhomboid family intramembrane serine protease [Haloferula luteola]MBB5352402.1 membrane associated rhomboid family serine protease [Haloferula luteola]
MSEPHLPAWKRSDAFPPASEGWGWVDRKGRRQSCSDLDALAAAIIDDAGARVDLVWTPEHSHLVLPEEIPALLPALKEARVRWAEWEIQEGARQMKWFGILAVVLAVATAMKPTTVGLAVILFLMLGFFPWYQGRKRLRRAKAWKAEEGVGDLEGLRFETWLMAQKAPVTHAMMAIIGVIALVQWLGPQTLEEQVKSAGLVKVNGRALDTWRLATAPFLHGHPLHLFFNASALLYLGRRMEVLARWPHLLLVFVLSAWVGGECSARWVAASSLGASGGLMGMLGFLMVYEAMHRRLVPESSRRRLLAGLLLTIGIGVVGFRFIDNGAHGGGLVLGMAYAFAVFPSSVSATRPKTTLPDRLAGAAAAGVFLWAAIFTLIKISA